VGGGGGCSRGGLIGGGGAGLQAAQKTGKKKAKGSIRSGAAASTRKGEAFSIGGKKGGTERLRAEEDDLSVVMAERARAYVQVGWAGARRQEIGRCATLAPSEQWETGELR